MKKLFLFALAVTALFSSCEKDPDLNKLDSDYAVYTNYDNGIQFNKFSSYYLPDSILVAGWRYESPILERRECSKDH